MLSISLLFAFILSFAVPEWRDRIIVQPLQSYGDWMVRFFSLQDSGWLPVAIIAPLLLAVGILEEWFEGLFYLALFTLVAWAVLDVPTVQSSPQNESDDSIFSRSNSALFCGALWFVLIHPLVAVGYRLLVWMTDHERLSGHDEWSPTLT